MKVADELKDESLKKYPAGVLRKFQEFHAANPAVYAEFARYSRQMREAGRDRYSAYGVVEVLRWHRNIATTGDVFKINNNFVPIYVRLFVLRHPEYATFFELRRVRSKGIGSDEENVRQLNLSLRGGRYEGK